MIIKRIKIYNLVSKFDINNIFKAKKVLIGKYQIHFILEFDLNIY